MLQKFGFWSIAPQLLSFQELTTNLGDEESESII
jgi:hypothetical protein